MQQYNVYSIYDVKAQTYGNIFISTTDGLALRLVRQIIEFGGNPDYARYSEDFALYCLGGYTDTDGLLIPMQPRLISTFTSVLRESRGAAVGGESPLKQQSASPVDSSSDAEKPIPVCDDEESPFSKA